MAAANFKEDFNKKTFEHEWIIKDFLDVLKNETLVENTTTEVMYEERNIEFATFLVGLKICSTEKGRYTRIYWKLLRKHCCLQNVEADLVIEIVNKDGAIWETYKSHATAVLGTDIEINSSNWSFPCPWQYKPNAHIFNADGTLKIKIHFTLTNLPDVLVLKSEDFRVGSKDELCLNLADLFNDRLSCDVKILTKDKIEINAHKLILRARCPVFASMFGSDFLKSSTNLVKVDDISAKTMEILLKYWYSGELLSSWKDKDIVAEFVYAAGKYQMTRVLKMLDDFLGLDFNEFDGDLGLLKIVQNMSLKKAETRLLTHIIHKIGQVTSGAELLRLVSLEGEKVDVKELAADQILKEFDDVFSEQNETHACTRHVKLLILACQLGMKNAEMELVKRIVGTVKKMKNADELFGLFDVSNEIHDDCSKDADLLVRANTK